MDMPDPMEGPDDPRVELGEIESIQNLDTARMTLRWALERLRALEKLNKELAAKADWEFRMRVKAEDDFKHQWDMEKAHNETLQKQREQELEKNFAAKLVEWERSYQDQAKQLEKDLAASAQKARAEAEDAQRKVVEEYTRKLTDLERLEHDRKQELAEREKEFERFCAVQKQHADTERREIRGEAQREAEEQYRTLQKLMDERLAALTGTWQREKESLLKDLDSWRTRSEEAMARALELERTSRGAEDLARSASRLADERAAEYLRLSETWERQRKSLEQQARQAQEQCAQLQAQVEELEKRHRFAQEQARQGVKVAEERQAESITMLESWERQRATLDEQLRHWHKRAAAAEESERLARDKAGDAEAAAEEFARDSSARHAAIEKRLQEREEALAGRERQLAEAIQTAYADFQAKRGEIERLKREALGELAAPKRKGAKK